MLTGVRFHYCLGKTFNLHKETFEPFRQSNDSPNYIHAQSNHPKPIIKNLPTAINKRLREISWYEEVFVKHKGDYENTPRKSSLPRKLSYKERSSSGKNHEQTHESTNDGDLNGTNPSSPSSPAEMPRKKETEIEK